MITFNGLKELEATAGRELGVSDWHEVTQAEVDAFAEVTGDHQWIHVDPERAAATPFGGTIAHGYFTLSLGPGLAQQVYAFDGISFGLNYGSNRVRFPSPMPVGDRVRLRVAISEVHPHDGWSQLVLTQTFEREGGDKPVCVAEQVVRLYA
jgi:acyl dehydratase